MATILGDAKIKLSLDIEAVKQQLQQLQAGGDFESEKARSEATTQEAAKKHENRMKGVQTTKNAPLGHAFRLARAMAYGNPALVHAPPLSPGIHAPAIVQRAYGHLARLAPGNARRAAGLPPANQTAMQAFVQNMTAARAAITGVQAWLAAKAVRAVINTVEASPKATAFLKGIAPGAATNAVDSFTSHVSDVVTDLKAKFTSFGRAAADEKAVMAAHLRLGGHVSIGGSVDLYRWLQNANEREERMRMRVEKTFDREVMQRLAESIRMSVNR